jgi:hypothetical protein
MISGADRETRLRMILRVELSSHLGMLQRPSSFLCSPTKNTSQMDQIIAIMKACSNEELNALICYALMLAAGTENFGFKRHVVPYQWGLCWRLRALFSERSGKR